MDKPQLNDLHCVRLCFHVFGATTDSPGHKSIGFAVSETILDNNPHRLLNRTQNNIEQ